MRILIACSGNSKSVSPFIKEQADAINLLGHSIDYYLITGKGFWGYFRNVNQFKRKIKLFNPDIIHAHYGLSGLFANFQQKIPVVTTFHGSDINDADVLIYSRWAHRLSAASIFVEESMLHKVKRYDKSFIIPCSVDTSVFHFVSKTEASKIIAISSEIPNILFSSSFDNPVKNYPLAKKSCSIAETIIGGEINLIELNGYSRDQVNLLMNASECVLLTSFSEGSPQIIKEAMACNCPIVTTNAGDVKWVLGKTEGCFITSFEPEDIAEKIKLAIEFREKHGHTRGRERILELGARFGKYRQKDN